MKSQNPLDLSDRFRVVLDSIVFGIDKNLAFHVRNSRTGNRHHTVGRALADHITAGTDDGMELDTRSLFKRVQSNQDRIVRYQQFRAGGKVVLKVLVKNARVF